MFQCAVLLAAVACALGATVPKVILPLLDGRIVGGNATTIRSYPWQCSLQHYGFHICGCAIIRHNYVVTAAHCLLSNPSTTGYLVRVGSTNCNTGGKLHKVKSLISHEHFSLQTGEHDIALVKLSIPIEFNSNTKDIRLATLTPANGNEAVVTGWGLTSEQSATTSDVLNAVSLNIISSECCASNDYGYESRIKRCMFCAGGDGKDSCQGDSGGPLVSDSVLAGIVSWGDGCGHPNNPGVYTDVACYYTWVLDKMDN